MKTIVCVVYLVAFIALVQCQANLQLQRKLQETSGYISGGNFGSSISVGSAHIAIGAPGENKTFLYNNDKNILSYRLLKPNDTVTGFGNSVATNGNYTFIGSTGVSAYMYQFVNNNWTLLFELNGVNETGGAMTVSNFGKAVAMDADYFAISCDDNINQVSYVLVYTYGNASYQQIFDIQKSQGTINSYGYSLSIDNGVLAVGANANGAAASIDFFLLPMNSPTNIPNPNDYNFGKVVSISGNLLAVGAPTSGSSVVYIYQLNSTSFTNIQNITGSGGFGTSLAMYGNYLFSGNPNANSYKGQTFGFYFNGIKFVSFQNFTGSQSLGGYGQAVGVYNVTLVVGAPASTLNVVTNAGVSYVYGTFGLASSSVPTVSSHHVTNSTSHKNATSSTHSKHTSHNGATFGFAPNFYIIFAVVALLCKYLY